MGTVWRKYRPSFCPLKGKGNDAGELSETSGFVGKICNDCGSVGSL